jgi:hypothetical protein
MKMLTALAKMAPARPSPASSVVPSRPTMAESASRKSGSAINAPSAGTARARIRRSVEISCSVTPPS